MNINREIYNNYYTADHMRLNPITAWDKNIVKLRFSYIEKYGTGRDVLDLCCGTGSYLIPMLKNIKMAVGVDFSSNMLGGFRKNIKRPLPLNLRLIESDAAAIPLKDHSMDFVFSYSSLYHVPNVNYVIKEVARVLCTNGYAALEIGNSHSLSAFVSNVCHEERGWAKSFPISYKKMRRYLCDARLEIVDWHAFQILPMYGASKSLLYLYPLLSQFWKNILGVQIGKKMLDDWLSSSWPLNNIAFRHLFLVTKRW